MANCPDDETRLKDNSSGAILGTYSCPKCGRDFRRDGNTLIPTVDILQQQVISSYKEGAITSAGIIRSTSYTFRVAVGKVLRAKYTSGTV
jgi:hypothetical protein